MNTIDKDKITIAILKLESIMDSEDCACNDETAEKLGNAIEILEGMIEKTEPVDSPESDLEEALRRG